MATGAFLANAALRAGMAGNPVVVATAMAAFAAARLVDKVLIALEQLEGGEAAMTPKMRGLLVIAYARMDDFEVCWVWGIDDGKGKWCVSLVHFN